MTTEAEPSPTPETPAEPTPEPTREEEAQAALEEIVSPPWEEGDAPEETPEAEGAPEGGDKTPSDPEPEPAQEPEGAAAPETPAKPSYADLMHRAREAAAKREEKTEPAAPQQDPRAQDLEVRERLMQEAMEAARRDPLAFLERGGHDLRAVHERLTQQLLEPDAAKQTDDVAALRKEIESLRTEQQQRDQKATQQASAKEQYQTYMKARSDFVEFTSSPDAAEKYPLLSTEDPLDRADLGSEVAAAMAQAGEPVAFTQVAAYIEERLAAQFDRWSARLGGTPDAQEPESETPKPEKSRKKGKTLTNALAAERSAPPQDLTLDQRMMEAARELAALTDDE